MLSSACLPGTQAPGLAPSGQGILLSLAGAPPPPHTLDSRPRPQVLRQGGDPPTPAVGGQAAKGRTQARRPDCQVSAAPGGMGQESASSARSRMLGALVFSSTNLHKAL